ncbi:hypothetical protein [Duodenibacillus massiliensis]|uniref:hypothetical protein n=1 Tax=Duodenibacillus massiliensis TaxID=1852381 RepID=UPI00094049F1|nr:hypothetical protein [Duodenibacillus massiliensis]
MAIQSQLRRSDIYVGDGVQTQFSFSFKLLKSEDAEVHVAPPHGVDAVLNPNAYVCVLNDDQDINPGGKITLKEPLVKGAALAVISGEAYVQPTVFTNRGAFFPTVLNDSLDRLTILCQQLVEQVSRALITDPTDAITPRQLRDKLLAAVDDAIAAAGASKETLAACEAIKGFIERYSWDIPHLVNSLEEVEAYPYDGYFWVKGYGNPGNAGEDISNRLVGGETLEKLFQTIAEKLADMLSKSAVLASPWWRTRQFTERLDPGILFTTTVDWRDSNSRYFLQGFCTDGEDTVWFAEITQDNASQRIVKYTVSTGARTSADYTDLYHANGLTYCNGKLYVTTLASDVAQAIAVVDAATLTREGFIALPAASGGAIAYDSYTDRFYAYANAKVLVYTTEWVLERSIPWSYPTWAPATGQDFGVYKGLLFFPRSTTSSTNVLQREEAIVVFDTAKCEVVWKWFLGGSFAELESVDFFKGAMLLGFNDGPNEIPFYLADFDLAEPSALPQTQDRVLAESGGFFGNLMQENVAIYVDASAAYAGDGTAAKPFNSLNRAIWCLQQTKKPYRAVINVAGDFSRVSVLYLQGLLRLVVVQQWAGKTTAVLPPLRINDSTVRFSQLTFKGVQDYGGIRMIVHAEGGEVDIRNCSFNSDGASLSPQYAIYTLRCDLRINTLDFSGMSSNLPTNYLVYSNSGSSLSLYSNLASFTFPDGFTGVRFFVLGPMYSQYSDCRSSMKSNMYVGAKTAVVYDGSGTGA